MPAWVRSANGKETNYIAQALTGTLITNATERAFLQAVIRGDKNGELAKALGYIGTVAYSASGSVQEPGSESRTDVCGRRIHIDSKLREGMRLVFDTDDPDHQRRILVLAQFHGWPGMNNTCVAIVDHQFNILDWRLNQTDDSFESASFDNVKQRLAVTCRHRSGGKVDYLYELIDNKTPIPGRKFQSGKRE